METLPLYIITVGFLIVLLPIRIDKTVIPDSMSIIVLLFVVVCFAVGNWSHYKFMSSFDSELVALVEIVTSVIASLVVLLSKISKENIVAAFSETTLSEDMPLVVLSPVVVPFIVFAGRLLLQSSGLRRFVV
jgi:glucan phosphoethanolaminetransferase (alkaline phosphatase superfamily)